MLLGWQPGHAEPILSLSSSADLANLAPGQAVTFDVGLAGLNPGDRLDLLQASVTFDSALLGTPTIIPGSVIPPGGFLLSGAFPGLADGTYDVFFGAFPPITTNGTFYSFTATVQGTGTGTISFDFVNSSGTDVLGSPLPPVTAGGSLSITSSSVGPVPIPEPATLVLLGIGGGIGALFLRRNSSGCPGGKRRLNCLLLLATSLLVASCDVGTRTTQSVGWGVAGSGNAAKKKDGTHDRSVWTPPES